jgi:hypothetical protein
MISHRIQFSCCEKQSVQLEWTSMNREKNNGLDKTILYLQKERQLWIQNNLPLIPPTVKHFHVNILPFVT